MFETLTGRLAKVFDRLKGRGALSEEDVGEALREIRVALLEADVALPVVKSFVAAVKGRAVGQEVLRSVTPGQQVVKVVHDHLVELLGGDAAELRLAGSPPSVVLMVGLQGSGKTTTSAKLALRLRSRERKKVLLASLDTRRPAAQRQLEVLAGQVEAASLPIVPGQGAVEIARRALDTARREGVDVLILDTAGRLAIDEALMAELVEVRGAAGPHETLLVADALTGQDAVATAKAFHERVGVTGIVLTRLDGDGRGGAALSMREITGQPIKFAGVGEKLDALEPFDPRRMAGRILDMGDVVGLVEGVLDKIDRGEAEKAAARLAKGLFDMSDLRTQLQQVRKMGGMGGIMGLLPGVQKMKAQLKDANLDDKVLVRQVAIIDSMTKKERRDPKLIDGSRRRRIAKGSGVEVSDVNKLLKQHRQMQDVMKQMRRAGGPGGLPGGLKALLGGGGGKGLPPGLLPPGLLPPR